MSQPLPPQPTASELEPPRTGAPVEADPRPLPPREPELEDCCGTGCVHCVFDTYQVALENYERLLAAWEARHPEQAEHRAENQAESAPPG